MNQDHASIDAMLYRVAARLRTTKPVYEELGLSAHESMAEWRGLHLLRSVLISGGGWEAMDETLFHRSDTLGDVFLEVGVSMRARFTYRDAHISLRIANDEGTLMRPCVLAQRSGEGVPLSDHITTMVLLGQAGWPLECLPTTMLPAVSTPLLRDALLDPSSSDDFVRRIAEALTHVPKEQHERMRSSVVMGRTELLTRLLEEGSLPPAAHAPALWNDDALPRWREAVRRKGGGDDDVLALLLEGWSARETKGWESYPIYRAVNTILDEQTDSGRAWLEQAYGTEIRALVLAKHGHSTTEYL